VKDQEKDEQEREMCSCPEPDYEHGGCNDCGLPVGPEHPWLRALAEANKDRR
jgi:hypothetical protein